MYMVSVIVAQAHFSWSLPVDELSSQLSSAIMGSGASTEHKSLIEGKTPEARGMQAQVSKFGENKAFTNRTVCFGDETNLWPPTKSLLRASKQTFFSRADGNPVAARNVVKFLRKTQCRKTKLWPPKGLFQAGKLTFLRNLCFPQKT